MLASIKRRLDKKAGVDQKKAQQKQAAEEQMEEQPVDPNFNPL